MLLGVFHQGIRIHYGNSDKSSKTPWKLEFEFLWSKVGRLFFTVCADVTPDRASRDVVMRSVLARYGRYSRDPCRYDFARCNFRASTRTEIGDSVAGCICSESACVYLLVCEILVGKLSNSK